MSLAAEVAFFGVLSIPPLLVGLISTAALVAFVMGPRAIDAVTTTLLNAAVRTFPPGVANELVAPTLHQILSRPHIAALSLGYLLAIWSGSRMVNALYQSVEILSERTKERSGIQRRLRAVKSVVIGFFVAVIGLPLLLVAPRLAARYLPAILQIIGWVVVAALIALSLALFMRGALPVRIPFVQLVKTSVLLVLSWVIFSGVLQWWLARSTKGIYGPLSAPIGLLLWMQVLAGAFLIATTYLAASEDRVRD